MNKRLTESQKKDLSRRVPGWGVDRFPSSRPGVPRVATDFDVTPHDGRPEDQAGAEREIHPPDSPVTPVFGTAVPLKVLAPSGWLRRIAYRVPQDKAGHWMTLILADRFDVLERRVRRLGLLALAIGAAFTAFAIVAPPRRASVR